MPTIFAQKEMLRTWHQRALQSGSDMEIELSLVIVDGIADRERPSRVKLTHFNKPLTHTHGFMLQ